VLGVKARALTRASLDACARLRLLASMIVAAEAGLAAGSERQRSWKQTAASERRSHLKIPWGVDSDQFWRQTEVVNPLTLETGNVT
jgi:hypothetical protein